MKLAGRGKKVHLTTTDPAAHLKFVLDEKEGISMSHIDEAEELKKYQADSTNEMLSVKAGNEVEWINQVTDHASGNMVLVAWKPEEVKGEKLLML